MKRNVVFVCTLISLIILSCGEERLAGNANYALLEKRIELIGEMQKKNNSYVNSNSQTYSKFCYFDNKLSNMIEVIETGLIKGERTISFVSEYSSFKGQSWVDLSFWKNTTMDMDEAVFIIEKLVYHLGASDICNDYYLFDQVDLKMDHNIQGNEIKVSWNANSTNFGEFIILGPVDSLSSSIVLPIFKTTFSFS